MEDNPNSTPATPGISKRPYDKPAFRHEPVFETMALTCSKAHASTVGPCKPSSVNS
jgi:hypothetical protein